MNFEEGERSFLWEKMMEGKIIFDVKGEEKKKLTVEDLLEKFSVNGEMSDKIVLS